MLAAMDPGYGWGQVGTTMPLSASLDQLQPEAYSLLGAVEEGRHDCSGTFQGSPGNSH